MTPLRVRCRACSSLRCGLASRMRAIASSSVAYGFGCRRASACISRTHCSMRAAAEGGLVGPAVQEEEGRLLRVSPVDVVELQALRVEVVRRRPEPPDVLGHARRLPRPSGFAESRVPMAGSAAVAGVLDGVRVLELGIWVAVPSAAFQLDNRGKRSVTLDLRRPAGRELAHALVRRSAVFLTNLRRQGRRRARMTRLGALAAAALVGCSASLGSVGILAPQAEGTGLKLL